MRNFSKKLLIVVGAAALFGAGLMIGANKFNKPKSVLHVITLQWKDGVTDAQKQTAIDGLEKMAGAMPGITNIWLKTLKVQPQTYNNAFAIEFKDEAAFKAYTDAPAHKEFEKIYLPLRGQSTTHDLTN
jgi:hypothetical protein